MMKLTFPHPCRSCGGLLVPPAVLPNPTYADADFVCLRCERPYRWVGDPPRLLTVLTNTPAADEEPEF